MSHQYNKVLLTFLTITNQIKLYHWQTLLHPRHTASGDLYSELDELVDKFIEVLHGKIILENNDPNYRIILDNKLNTITLINYNDNNIITLISNIKNYLESNELIVTIGRSTDLLNIRDEMLALINKTTYLFTLK